MIAYLDNSATTRPTEGVIEAMVRAMREGYFNPSSVYQPAVEAFRSVRACREAVLEKLGAVGEKLVFTSGGTEANNLAIRGVLAARPEKRHVVTTAVEHDSVLRPMQQLEREGYRVTYLGVDSLGHLDLSELEASLSDQTALVSIMHANNETGVIFPVEKVAALTATKGIPLHVDAVQTTGKVRDASGHSPLNLDDVPVDLLTASAHKFHGPKGIGALYMRDGTEVQPLVYGGGQERGLRSSTENVPGIVGMGEAIELGMSEMDESVARMTSIRDRMIEGTLANIDGCYLNGPREGRLCNNAHFRFDYIEGEALIMSLDMRGIAASTGSACSSRETETSHVLQAIGVRKEDARGSLRITLSKMSTLAEAERYLTTIEEVTAKLRNISPIALLHQGSKGR